MLQLDLYYDMQLDVVYYMSLELPVHCAFQILEVSVDIKKSLFNIIHQAVIQYYLKHLKPKHTILLNQA